MLRLYFATPDFACQYSGCLLSPADQMRLQQNPHLANQIQWQVSRAVKAVVSCEWGVLSHSANHVAWLVSDESSGSLKMGVDLQHMKFRCFSAWHDLILSASECAWLREQHFAPVAYFALWALKESLIKANDLDWADLRDVGLVPVPCHLLMFTNGCDIISFFNCFNYINNNAFSFNELVDGIYPSC